MPFCVQSRCGDPDVRGLRVLHLSLNAPVIAIDELPVGPARAGLALCEGPAGDLEIRIAIRSLRTAQLAAYAPSAGPLGSVDRALEAALSFAEGMGFLFDEDEVSARGAEAAACLWREFVDDVPERLRIHASADDSAPAAVMKDPMPAFEVPVVAGGSHDAVSVETVRALAAAPAVANPAVVLSKFRTLKGSIAAPIRPAASGAVGEEPVVARIDPQHPRIRLLSRF